MTVVMSDCIDGIELHYFILLGNFSGAQTACQTLEEGNLAVPTDLDFFTRMQD